MFRLINAADFQAKGFLTLESFDPLRPILAANANPFVDNATLRKDEWEQVDDRVNAVMRERLTIVDDLRGRGLVTPVSVGTLLRITERLEDFAPADVSYDGDTAPEEDRPSYLRDTIPVPIISKGFRIGFRQLAASRERGEALDTTAAELATRKVRDQIQALCTVGFGHGPDGNVIPGLTTASHRIPVTLATAWDAATTPDIIGDVESMLAAAYEANLFGPFLVYIPKNYWALLQGDYSTQKGDRTFLERIEAFSEIESVRPLDSLPDDEVIMLQATRDVLDITEAQVVQTIQWEKNPMVTMFRVMTILAPHIKKMEKAGDAVTTAAGSSNTIHGIIHLS